MHVLTQERVTTRAESGEEGGGPSYLLLGLGRAETGVGAQSAVMESKWSAPGEAQA